MSDEFDVVVIGGGAAGLSGAVVLARSRRSVLVVDAGSPRNAPAAGVHGLLGQEGVPPGELLARGRDELRAYGGTVVSGRVVSARQDPGAPGPAFLVGTQDGRVLRARRLLVATGLVDELPDVPGVRERWGRDVLHCPYCHGWEVRDQAIGILGTSARGVHQALMFRQLSDDVVLFRHTAPPLSNEQSASLRARGIRVVDGVVDELVVGADGLTGVRIGSEVVARQAVVVGPRFTARVAGLEGLGLPVEALEGGLGTHVPTGETGATSVPGVWLAGNVTDVMAQVGGAMAAGTRAGAAINGDLLEEDVRAALAS